MERPIGRFEFWRDKSTPSIDFETDRLVKENVASRASKNVEWITRKIEVES